MDGEAFTNINSVISQPSKLKLVDLIRSKALAHFYEFPISMIPHQKSLLLIIYES